MVDKRLGKVSVLYRYFGPKNGETLRDFNEECKQLSDEEKLLLAIDAARDMKLSQADVSFAL